MLQKKDFDENYYLKNLKIIDNFSNESDIDNVIHVNFKYKFDDRNNWIEIIKNVDGKDLYIWKREITYY